MTNLQKNRIPLKQTDIYFYADTFPVQCTLMQNLKFKWEQLIFALIYTPLKLHKSVNSQLNFGKIYFIQVQTNKRTETFLMIYRRSFLKVVCSTLLDPEEGKKW